MTYMIPVRMAPMPFTMAIRMLPIARKIPSICGDC
jgi:hypothetical protein